MLFMTRRTAKTIFNK